MTTPGVCVLSINTGSSSLKAALYDMGAGERLLLSVSVDAIGQSSSRVSITGAEPGDSDDSSAGNLDHDAALQLLFDTLTARKLSFDAIGHRIVYGGTQFHKPGRLDAQMLAALRSYVPRDPQHMPQALHAADTISHRFPEARQFACFDTAFHADLPDVARKFALPRRFYDAGLRRFGFHGLSCEFIVDALSKLDPIAGDGRVIVAHLGSGSSVTAIHAGKSVDTTMGFTPNSGLVMSTRAGDIDATAVLHLMEQGMTTQAVSDLIGLQSGLLGVSGSSGDMRRLIDAADDPLAQEAVAMYCYRARKYLGAYIAALGGLETLVFTGGIGEHSAVVRDRICQELQCFGIHIDTDRNQCHAPAISGDDSRVTVRVIHTDEALMVARHTARLAKSMSSA